MTEQKIFKVGNKWITRVPNPAMSCNECFFLDGRNGKCATNLDCTGIMFKEFVHTDGEPKQTKYQTKMKTPAEISMTLEEFSKIHEEFYGESIEDLVEHITKLQDPEYVDYLRLQKKFSKDNF